ncbi:MAG: tripartite tricarboxylate transporter substrate binding protein [Betaproteobacteria bacterium]|nr:tripartite tricarboxylate transporter substrate binding protein [Betaproteobacteria bacterium]
MIVARALFVLALVVPGLAAEKALAQPFPTKPVRLIVPFTPGGISDLLARSLGTKLGPVLGQQIVVENRPGAGTTIASEVVARSSPDGHTLYLQDITTHAINASLYRRLPYDSVKDFTLIQMLATTPLILVVHPSLPVKSVKELIAFAKVRPGQIVYGSSGNGTIVHLSTELFKSMAGIDMVHVPFKGSPQSVAALLGGEVAVSFPTMPPALPNVQAGKLRALAVTSPKRSNAAPDVPTVSEAGLKGYEMVLYSGIIGPANIPPQIVSRLNAEIGKAIRSPELKPILDKVGAEPVTMTPEQFGTHLRSEVQKLGAIVRSVGASVD